MLGQFFVVLDPEFVLELEPEPVEPEPVDPEVPELFDGEGDVVPEDPDVVELVVAALATSAPPPTSPAVSAPMASALRRRNFMGLCALPVVSRPPPSGGHDTACATDLWTVVRPAWPLGGVGLRSDDDSQETAVRPANERASGSCRLALVRPRGWRRDAQRQGFGSSAERIRMTVRSSSFNGGVPSSSRSAWGLGQCPFRPAPGGSRGNAPRRRDGLGALRHPW